MGEMLECCGWIGEKAQCDPATALKHFAHVDDGSADPIVAARLTAYWRGRANGRRDLEQWDPASMRSSAMGEMLITRRSSYMPQAHFAHAADPVVPSAPL